jgi:hypothetical protein
MRLFRGIVGFCVLVSPIHHCTSNLGDARHVLENAHVGAEFPVGWMDAVTSLLDDVTMPNEGFIAGFLSCVFEQLSEEQLGLVCSLLVEDQNSRAARVLWLGLKLCEQNQKNEKNFSCRSQLHRLLSAAELEEQNLEFLTEVVAASDSRAVADIFMLSSAEILDVVEGIFSCSGLESLLDDVMEEASRFNKTTLLEDGLETFNQAKRCRALLTKLAVRHPSVLHRLEREPGMKDLTDSLKKRM